MENWEERYMLHQVWAQTNVSEACFEQICSEFSQEEVFLTRKAVYCVQMSDAVSYNMILMSLSQCPVHAGRGSKDKRVIHLNINLYFPEITSCPTSETHTQADVDVGVKHSNMISLVTDTFISVFVFLIIPQAASSAASNV